MRVEVREVALDQVEADLLAVPLFEGEDLAGPFANAPGAEDAKGGYKKLTLLRPERPRRVLVVGLGKRDDFEIERARVAAALAVRQAEAVDATSLALALAEGPRQAERCRALVEGAVLASYRFDRYKRQGDDDEDRTELESLTLIGSSKLAAAAEQARVVAEAANRARELQDLPANVKNPAYLAERAEEIAAAHESIKAEILGPEQIAALGMGGLTAISQGSAQEPRLIVLEYAGGGEGADVLGLVGKGVTFDSGGISIKPSERMQEMKMDMSGAAAVMEAVGAIAELGLSLNVTVVVPAVENMPSGNATRPGDIITQYNGKTVEVNNTDAEGRLILADALAFCSERGATRIVDLATLTGAVLTALGSTYAGLMSNDDDLAARIEAAAEETGELAWRLPLHPEYKELFKGQVADLKNVSDKRKASTIYAGSFLEEFVDGTPWAHLDIAGTAWDVGREYVGKGATGYGVRLLVALARGLAAK